jgi:hypothetical protein
MDEIFHQVRGIRGIFDVVGVAKRQPRRYGKKGELLIAYDETEEAREMQRRRSSVVANDAHGGDGKKHGGDVEEKVERVDGK